MMFADDTKLWVKIYKETNGLPLQTDLDKLCDWSRKWLLQFNPAKCKVMHIGHELNTKYYMAEGTNKVEVQCVNEAKNRGVFLTSDLTFSRQCFKSAARVSSSLGLIQRHFWRLDTDGFLLVDNTYGRQHLEYCIQDWSPVSTPLKRTFTALKQSSVLQQN